MGPTTEFHIKDSLNSYYLISFLCIDQIRKPQHPLVMLSLIYMHQSFISNTLIPFYFLHCWKPLTSLEAGSLSSTKGNVKSWLSQDFLGWPTGFWKDLQLFTAIQQAVRLGRFWRLKKPHWIYSWLRCSVLPVWILFCKINHTIKKLYYKLG